MELLSLDEDLKRNGTIKFTSLIWIDRYNRVGSCEIYAPATPENIRMLKDGLYVKRTDHPYVFRIKYVLARSDSEGMDYITAYAYDTKDYLDQRINTKLALFQSYNAGNDLELLLQNNVLGTVDMGVRNPFLKWDGTPLFSTRPPTTVGGVCNQSIQCLPWGSVVRQVCGSLGYGYDVRIVDASNPGGRQLRLGIYSGVDRSASVRFSRGWRNVGSESYETDTREKGNVILAKSEESSTVAVYGSGEGTDRVERFVESTVTPVWSYEDIRGLVEGTLTLAQAGTAAVIRATGQFIPILSQWQLDRLRATYPGGSTTERDGYYYIPGTSVIGVASDTQVADVTDNTAFTLEPFMVDYLLLCDAAEEASSYKVVDEVTAELLGNRFVYKTDYNLGDIVLVQSKYGPISRARIVEVMESWDQNGYRLEPRTSYTEV